MPNELITPNLHAVLIHYPLGILIAGISIELFSFLYRRSSFRTAGRWMILLGALSAVPATFSGIYALRADTGIEIDAGKTWAEIKTDSPVLSRPEVWETLRHHLIYESIATGIAVFVVLVWLGASDGARKWLYWILLPMLVWDMAIMIVASHHGGQAVYKNGVAVQAVFPTTAESSNTEPTTAPVNWTNTPTRAEMMFPPLELHITLAGVAIAIAIASIGLSFRKINATRKLADEPIVTGHPSAPGMAPPTPPTSVEMVRTFNPDLELEFRPFAPASRFWLLTFLLALVTFLGGLWVIARGAEVFTTMNGHPNHIPQLLWEQVRLKRGEKITRGFAHAVVGTAIVILPLILAGLARFAPRQKILLSIFTLILAAAVSVQIWVGVLMLYDTDQGKLLYWNPPAAVESSQHD